jgi:hypothetical protein
MKAIKILHYLNVLPWHKGIKKNTLNRGGTTMFKYKTAFLVAVAVLVFFFVSVVNAKGAPILDPTLRELWNQATPIKAKARKLEGLIKGQKATTNQAKRDYERYPQTYTEFKARIRVVLDKYLKEKYPRKGEEWKAKKRQALWRKYRTTWITTWKKNLAKRKQDYEHQTAVLKRYEAEYKRALDAFNALKKRYFTRQALLAKSVNDLISVFADKQKVYLADLREYENFLRDSSINGKLKSLMKKRKMARLKKQKDDLNKLKQRINEAAAQYGGTVKWG